MLSTVWSDGGRGGETLAHEVVKLCDEKNSDFSFAYNLDNSIEEKIEEVVKKIYGGDGIVVTPAAQKQTIQKQRRREILSPAQWNVRRFMSVPKSPAI